MLVRPAHRRWDILNGLCNQRLLLRSSVMSYPGGTGPHEAPMPCASMHEVLTTSQILSYFPPLDGDETSVTDNSVLNIHELWQDGDLQLLDVASPTFQGPSIEPYMAEELCGNPVKPFQDSGSSSIPMSGANETKNDLSQTAERLILQMEQFTYTIHQYGDSTNKLESKINACTNSIGRIEQHLNAIAHRTDNMEDQLGSMNQRLNDMEEKMESLDLKLKTLDGYLYEIVKREKDMMKEFCDFRRT